jgi:hypothetical protein
MNTSRGVDTSKITARIVGVLFLVATATYMAGTGLINSMLTVPNYLANVYPQKAQLITGVLLQFVDAAAVVGIGVLLYPILKKRSETVALGYAGTRILECAFLVLGGIGTLSLVALSQATIQAGTASASYAVTSAALLVSESHTAYLIAMGVLGLGSLPFCYLLYRSRLVPRALSILGLAGYAALLVGSLLELFGLNLYMLHYVPGGLFELILPIWLILKGFSASPVVPESSMVDTREVGEMSLSNA